jgi:hypothetical protein
VLGGELTVAHDDRLPAEWRQVGEYIRNANRTECEASQTGADVQGANTMGRNNLFGKVGGGRGQEGEGNGGEGASLGADGAGRLRRGALPHRAARETARRSGGRRGPPTTGGGGRALHWRPQEALALVGAWGEFVGDEEIDTMVGEIYAARDRDTGRPVDLEA